MWVGLKERGLALIWTGCLHSAGPSSLWLSESEGTVAVSINETSLSFP